METKKKRIPVWLNADRIGSVAIGLITIVILGSFLSPDVRTMMGFGQGQAQQGQAAPEATKPSSPMPQTPKLSFQYEPAAQQVGGDLPYQMIIWVATDAPIRGFQLRIVCDAACVFQSADEGKDAAPVSNRQINDKTIEVGFNEGLNSNQKRRVVLRGKTAFHMSAIDKI